MTAKMLRFVTLGRAMPEKRGPEARRQDFEEIYADYAKLPVSQVRNVRDYIPKTAVDPGRIAGMGEIIADAVQLKFIAAPLTEPQTRELVQMPSR